MSDKNQRDEIEELIKQQFGDVDIDTLDSVMDIFKIMRNLMVILSGENGTTSLYALIFCIFNIYQQGLKSSEVFKESVSVEDFKDFVCDKIMNYPFESMHSLDKEDGESK